MNYLARKQSVAKDILRPVTVIIAWLFCLPLSAQPAANTANLAKVAIIEFEDRTGSQNYAYLSSSLSSAINTSMQTKFDYAAVDAEMAQKTALELRAKSGKFEGSEATEFCKATATDILVYGSYEIDAQTGQIAMKTKINFALINRTVTLDPLLNPIDASLFQATDMMATKIVEKVAEMARKTMSPGSDTPATESGAENQKVSLMKMEEVSWSKVNHEINVFGGYAKGGTNKLASLDKGYLLAVEVLRNSDFRKTYAGLTFLSIDQTGNGITHTGWAVMGQFGLNFFTIGNRVKPFVELDLGFGNNRLSNLGRQVTGGVWLGARFGLKILMSERFSLTVDTRFLNLIAEDTKSWLYVANAGVGFNF